jgi:hypothetical protein
VTRSPSRGAWRGGGADPLDGHDATRSPHTGALRHEGEAAPIPRAMLTVAYAASLSDAPLAP